MNEYYLPVARKNNLVIQELPNELLIYDLNRNKALCLNQTAKLILQQCDGKRTFREAAENIKRETKSEISDEIFWVALQELKKNKLLDENQPISELRQVSRRDLMRSGLKLSIALPLITALIAPSATQAQSTQVCTPAGEICSTFGSPLMDNCCVDTGCTQQVNGVCCIIINTTLDCDPNNDLCCPDTVCNPQTNKCISTLP